MEKQQINLNTLQRQMEQLREEHKDNKRYFQNKLSRERKSKNPSQYAIKCYEDAIQDYNDKLASLDQDVETLTKLLKKLDMSCRY